MQILDKVGEVIDGIIFHKEYPAFKYKKDKCDKSQIVLHHTVSGDGVEGDIAWWLKTLQRIGTAFIIDRKGYIHQMFSSKYWAYHLGVNSDMLFAANSKLTAKQLNMSSIGIELDSWGGLVEYNSKFYPILHYDTSRNLYVPNRKCKPLDKNQVLSYSDGYRGLFYFEKYTGWQIEALYYLLLYLCDRYDISKVYNPDIFNVCDSALQGKNGIYTHTSYRRDKSDCHPQLELIQMLKSL